MDSAEAPTLRERGFRMLAEWEPHRGTWLSWPHNEASWPGLFERIPDTFAQIVRELAVGEEVHINVSGAEMEAEARTILGRTKYRLQSVFFHHNPTNDAWCRDHGPIFVNRSDAEDGEQAIVNWGYNAWGGKYPPFDLDDRVPSRIGSEYDLEVVTPGMILEGGSIDVNGEGSLLTTEQCLLHPNRNPSLDRAEIERRLRDNLGVTNILWLGEGIVGDDTDGHVDDITRFVAADTIVTALEDDPNDSNYGPLQANLTRLKKMRDQSGKPFNLMTLPMPAPVVHDGVRLPASYANFYVGNEVVLLPGYDSERDSLAAAILQDCFPTRRIVVIDCTELVWGLGAFHCLTQQWPQTADG